MIAVPQYGECEYWDERYSREPASFDWYQGFGGLQSILQLAFPLHATILQVGVGSSRLQEDMARAGWRHIINVDYSRVVVDHMSELHKGVRALEYRVADVRNMPEFVDCSFEGVLDKGTLDAVLCGEHSAKHAAAMLSECYRVLKPGCPLMLVTYGDPASRLPYLEEIVGWNVVVYALTKQEVLEAMDAEPVVKPLIKGPYPSSNADCMDALSGLEGMHFVYLCFKSHDAAPSPPPPSLPQPELQGAQAAQHPEHDRQAEQKQPQQQQRPQSQQQQLASGVFELRADDGDTGASAPPERPAATAFTAAVAAAPPPVSAPPAS
ncbi:hypothetical protein PLESTB_000280800 [Pleodorina starrii]|uniref:Methyltransferase type 11 domain-containing protein n=1 Tax=Pleodorina starrii TaxID=330485 RepID=A0A9W6BDH6_9CHLO|nr:hypothetical protein PLESTB_000280800 [Pleodorina starrii]